ncbi:MAG: glycosyl transferase [Novosphingobium sp.]|nr:MAG: glycosyl transferase [Novosphingobium sp.]
MKFAYLIMAHAAPEQLLALIERLAAGSAENRIILHLDRRSSLWREHRERFASHHSRQLVLIDQPVAVVWGHDSICAAQRLLLKAALTEGFDYCHLLSGADWPVALPGTIARDIAAFEGRRPAFIDIYGEEQCERMEDWWFDSRPLRLSGFPRINENVNRAQTRVSWTFSRWYRERQLQRRRYADLPWLKGSMWWSLPHDVAHVVHAEVTALEASGRLRFTQCPDEHVIPTVLARRFPDRIEPGFRYIDWSAGGYHPKVLRQEDEASIATSGAWFARKFDSTTDDFFLAPESFGPIAQAAE